MAMYISGEMIFPVWPTCISFGAYPASTAAREAPTAAPILSAKLRTKRIVNALASEFRILIGYEGPAASILKLRPPMPFRREHADLLVRAIDAAATAIDRGAA